MQIKQYLWFNTLGNAVMALIHNKQQVFQAAEWIAYDLGVTYHKTYVL